MLTYIITEEDFSNPHYNHIIQANYGDRHFTILKNYIKKKLNIYITDFSEGKIDLEELNNNILLDVEYLKTKYPDSFVPEGELGYYSKKILADYYLSGRCIIDNVNCSDLIKDKKEKLEQAKVLKEEKERIEQEEKLLKEQQAEEARVPVIKGMRFKDKFGLFDAYKDVLPARCTINTFKTYITEFAEVKYVQGHWLVVKVIKEGGRAWEGTTSL